MSASHYEIRKREKRTVTEFGRMVQILTLKALSEEIRYLNSCIDNESRALDARRAWMPPV